MEGFMKKYIINLFSLVILSLFIFGVIRENSNIPENKDYNPEPDSAYARYFPMSVGNKFVYLYSNFYPGQTWVSKALITKDTIINGKKYFYCQNFPYISSLQFRNRRIPFPQRLFHNSL